MDVGRVKGKRSGKHGSCNHSDRGVGSGSAVLVHGMGVELSCECGCECMVFAGRRRHTATSYTPAHSMLSTGEKNATSSAKGDTQYLRL